MDNKEEFITIKDASRIYNLNINTLYKYIQQGKIKVENHTIRGRKIQRLTKSEIEEFLGIDIQQHTTTYNQTVTRENETLQQNTIYNNEKQNNTTPNKEQQINTTTYNELTKDSIREVIEEFFSSKQAELVKPMEEMALYRLGGLEKENLFLKERLETVLNEYKELQDKMKALPDFQKEKEDIEARLLQEKEQAIKELEAIQQKEKEDLLANVEKHVKELEKYKSLPAQLEDTSQKLQEKEEEIKVLEVKLQKEKEELEKKFKSESEEKARAKAEAEQALKQLTSLPAPVESIQQILLDNANNIKELSREKETFQSVLKENESTIKEKERALKELEEIRRQELEQVKKQAEEEKARLLEEKEKEKQEIAEAWKKELELAKRPWWKFW